MKNVTVKRRPQIGVFIRRWWMLALPVLSIIFVLLAKQSPTYTEMLYASGLYPILAGTLGRLISLIPFSVFEMIICALVVITIVMIARWLIYWAQVRKGKRARHKTDWRRIAECAVKLVCCMIFAFVILCGLNYYRPEFTTFSGLTVQESPVEELEALCSELVLRANTLGEQVERDIQGVTVLSGSYAQTAQEAKNTFGKLAKEFSVLPDLELTPKPIVNSWWMSMLQITGVFSPFTYEANVNIAAPDYSIPATMCHELAHTRGFMREDEANFIGYLACEQSDSAEFLYSGVMLALVHSINRLYAVDRAAFTEINMLLSEQVRQDLAYNSAYWAQYDGPVAEVSTAVNNTYLRVNSQSDGVQSYGRMVDLLLADYRARQISD